MTHSLTNIRYFALLCLSLALMNWAFQFLLVSDDLFMNFLLNRYDYDRVQEIIKSAKEHQWFGYAIAPITYFIKLSLVSTCLFIGSFFADKQFKFSVLFRSATLAEFVFLLPILITLFWFLFIQPDYDLNDLSQFAPLSALNLFDTSTVPKYGIHPLQTLNLFEVAYWFLLAYGVAEATALPFKRAFGLVMSSYGVGLLLWVVLVMFLTITYS